VTHPLPLDSAAAHLARVSTGARVVPEVALLDESGRLFETGGDRRAALASIVARSNSALTAAAGTPR